MGESYDGIELDVRSALRRGGVAVPRQEGDML